MSAFAIGRYEVTFEEYDAFCEATGCEQPDDKDLGRGRLPVVHVTWSAAAAYVAWLPEQTGEPYRLPTEQDWEYAARAGSHGAYGSPAKGAGLLMNHSEQSYKKPRAAGTLPPNKWGLHEVHGNAWEWTRTDVSGKRVIKGGSWANGAYDARAARRYPVDPG